MTFPMMTHASNKIKESRNYQGSTDILHEIYLSELVTVQKGYHNIYTLIVDQKSREIARIFFNTGTVEFESAKIKVFSTEKCTQ